MKQNVLALAGCIAATAPSVSIADVLPENAVGLNLGEIRSSSFLNQPFKGVIPFLFASYEDSKNLSVQIAPDSVFHKVGISKQAILGTLSFQIIEQDNKPVILISSEKPITSLFLNLILEIKGQDSTIYQKYTVLLDPEVRQNNLSLDANFNNLNTIVEPEGFSSSTDRYSSNIRHGLSNEEIEAALLLTSLSANTASSSNQKLQHKVKTGDSLFKIALKQNNLDSSFVTVSKLIFQKNPKAFINGDINKLKTGVVLNLPTAAEVNGFEVAKVEVKPELKLSTQTTTISNEESITDSENTYTVLKGDNLSKITERFSSEESSFTELMNTIYVKNPDAFVNKDKNQLKAGAELNISTIPPNNLKTEEEIVKVEDTFELEASEATTAKNTDIDLKPNQYLVKAGDTLSSVANENGHKEVPFAKMLKAIHKENADAFVNGKMSNLIVGSILTIPALNTFESIAATVTEDTSTIKNATNIKDVAASNLSKRVRELRKELKLAEDNLSELKNSLSNKELLLQQKNVQVKSLNTLLTHIKKEVDPKILAAAVIKTKVNMPKDEVRSSFRPKSKSEIAKLKRDLLKSTEVASQQVEKIKKLKNLSPNNTKPNSNSSNNPLFKEYKLSSILDISNSNYAYAVIALLLGLVLIRYRRAIYSYTQYRDDQEYYPVPEPTKYDLSEKNINFTDSVMDDYEHIYKKSSKDNSVDSADTSVNENIDNSNEGAVSSKPESIEVKEQVYATEEDKKIAECEHLVNELFDDISDAEKRIKESEWSDIEKVCDSFIHRMKANENKDTLLKKGAVNEKVAVVEEATDFNNMMTDLLESLDKVDESVKRNNLNGKSKTKTPTS